MLHGLFKCPEPVHRTPCSSCLNEESGTAMVQVMAGESFRKFLQLFVRVLVERSAAETVTKGGIMFPEKPQGKLLQAMVLLVL